MHENVLADCNSHPISRMHTISPCDFNCNSEAGVQVLLVTAQTQSTQTQTSVFGRFGTLFSQMLDRSLMAQFCSQLIVPFKKANFHISDHPHMVYGNALSQHPAGLELVYTSVPSQVPLQMAKTVAIHVISEM